MKKIILLTLIFLIAINLYAAEEPMLFGIKIGDTLEKAYEMLPLTDGHTFANEIVYNVDLFKFKQNLYPANFYITNNTDIKLFFDENDTVESITISAEFKSSSEADKAFWQMLLVLTTIYGIPDTTNYSQSMNAYFYIDDIFIEISKSTFSGYNVNYYIGRKESLVNDPVKILFY